MHNEVYMNSNGAVVHDYFDRLDAKTKEKVAEARRERAEYKALVDQISKSNDNLLARVVESQEKMVEDFDRLIKKQKRNGIVLGLLIALPLIVLF